MLKKQYLAAVADVNDREVGGQLLDPVLRDDSNRALIYGLSRRVQGLKPGTLARVIFALQCSARAAEAS